MRPRVLWIFQQARLGKRIVFGTTLIAQYSRKPADMPSGIIGIMLQDDNDANLSNGTPNFQEIAAAADRHNLPRPPDPTAVQIAHTPLTDNGDIVNNQVVTVAQKPDKYHS